MSQTGMDLQDLINGLGTEAHWGNLESLLSKLSHPDRKAAMEEDKAKRESEKLKWQADLIDIFGSKVGIRVLETLIQSTLQKPSITLSPELLQALSSDQVAMISTYREGQNSIVRAIIKDLAEAGFDPSNKKEKSNA